MTYTLSGFADEISADLPTQLSTLQSLEIEGLDLRSAFGKNVMALSDSELQEVRRACEDAGRRVQTIGSPIGKDANASIERAAEAAHICGTRRIRVFTPELDAGDRDGAARFTEAMLRVAEREDVILLLENDGTLWSAYPSHAKWLFDRFDSPHLMAAFDFANTVILGYGPNDWFPWLTPRLDTIHIKDAVRSTKTVVPAGEGDGMIEETLRRLFHGGWSGPLTLEPHLAHAGAAAGFSGPELFKRATDALKTILARISS